MSHWTTLTRFVTAMKVAGFRSAVGHSTWSELVSQLRQSISDSACTDFFKSGLWHRTAEYASRIARQEAGELLSRFLVEPASQEGETSLEIIAELYKDCLGSGGPADTQVLRAARIQLWNHYNKMGRQRLPRHQVQLEPESTAAPAPQNDVHEAGIAVDTKLLVHLRKCADLFYVRVCDEVEKHGWDVPVTVLLDALATAIGSATYYDRKTHALKWYNKFHDRLKVHVACGYSTSEEIGLTLAGWLTENWTQFKDECLHIGENVSFRNLYKAYWNSLYEAIKEIEKERSR